MLQKLHKFKPIQNLQRVYYATEESLKIIKAAICIETIFNIFKCKFSLMQEST